MPWRTRTCTGGGGGVGACASGVASGTVLTASRVYGEVIECHRRDVADPPQRRRLLRAGAREQQHAERVAPVERPVASAAHVRDAAPVGELVAAAGGQQHVARVGAAER